MRAAIFARLAAIVPAVASILAAAPPARADLSDRYAIDVHKPLRAYGGTTIFCDMTDPDVPLLVEVDMAGKVVWHYRIPPDREGSGGTDTEWVPATDTILYTMRSGVYEVNRAGKIVWSHKAPSSHDADRLPNGNTLVVYGWGEESRHPEVREVSPDGKVVWQWHAAKHLGAEKPLLAQEGYTHTNSAVRLANGHTLISLRNFYMLVEVARSGEIVWRLPGLYTTPHDPEILPNGNILVNTRGPQVISEYTPGGRIVWQYRPDPREVNTVRYNHRLPNGNTIFVERTKIVEIAPNREVVWQLRLTDVSGEEREKSRWLYKAERIPDGRVAAPVHAFAAPSETLARTGEAVRSTDERNREVAVQRARNMIARFDRDGDGRLSREEFPEPAQFAGADADRDGFVDPGEAEDHVLQRLGATDEPARKAQGGGQQRGGGKGGPRR